MTETHGCVRGVVLALWTIGVLVLSGGCTPVDRGELEMFVTGLLRNAAAAFLL